MFGYRARIGYISPSVIELNAYDFYRIVPKGVGLKPGVNLGQLRAGPIKHRRHT
ncbi:MAG: hypothetical protein ACREQ7_09380 [Candidatus Binatia bacterium]